MAESEREYLQRLEDWLASYDHVFLIPGEAAEDVYISGVLGAGAGKTGERRLLLLSSASLTAGAGFIYRQISMEEEEQLRQLYHMYEFSDRFSVISTETTHGSLFNLVENGLLDMEEAAEALFMNG